MMIDLDLLLAWGGTYKKYNAGEFVFNEGANCTCYNQLVEGQVKWVNYNDEGKEFIQTLIEPGECLVKFLCLMTSHMLPVPLL